MIDRWICTYVHTSILMMARFTLCLFIYKELKSPKRDLENYVYPP